MMQQETHVVLLTAAQDAYHGCFKTYCMIIPQCKLPVLAKLQAQIRKSCMSFRTWPELPLVTEATLDGGTEGTIQRNQALIINFPARQQGSWSVSSRCHWFSCGVLYQNCLTLVSKRMFEVKSGSLKVPRKSHKLPTLHGVQHDRKYASHVAGDISTLFWFVAAERQ